MVKVKMRKEMTLPELVEWAWKKGITEKAFYSNLDGGSVYFDKVQNVSVEHEIAINETFTVEVEEDISEDTKIEKNVELSDNAPFIYYYNRSIQELKDDFSKVFYSLNDDMTMTLIWKDGAMVE